MTFTAKIQKKNTHILKKKKNLYHLILQTEKFTHNNNKKERKEYVQALL